MGRVSKRIKQRQAAAEAAELVQLNREQDADTAANIEKLRWEKGRHFNVFEKQCVLRVYYSALSLDRIHHRAAKAAGQVLMLHPQRVSYIVKSWKKHGEVRASGTGRRVRRVRSNEKEKAEREEEEEIRSETGDVAGDERDSEDDREDDSDSVLKKKQSVDGRTGSMAMTGGKPKIKRSAIRARVGAAAGAIGGGKRKRVEKDETPGGCGSGGAEGDSVAKDGLGRGSRGAKKPDRLDL